MDSYIVPLPYWNSDLITGINRSNLALFSQYITTNNHAKIIYFVSDGGAHTSNNTSSFGWVILSTEGDINFKHNRQVPGSLMGSFCVKEYDALSGLLFLMALQGELNL